MGYRACSRAKDHWTSLPVHDLKTTPCSRNARAYLPGYGIFMRGTGCAILRNHLKTSPLFILRFHWCVVFLTSVLIGGRDFPTLGLFTLNRWAL